MIGQTYECKIVPFSARIIREYQLHIVDSDKIGGSSILMMLDGEIDARMPEHLAVCFFNGEPIGIGLACLIFPGDNYMLSYDDDRDHEIAGYAHIYTKDKHREKGIGKKLLNMALDNFRVTYPRVPRVMMSYTIRDRFGRHESIEPVYAQVGKAGEVKLLHRVVRRSLISRDQTYSFLRG